MNYFLKLLCLFCKHKHFQVGKIYQFLSINQSKIQKTEYFKSLSLKFYGTTCQEVSIKAFETSALYITKLELRGGIVLFFCQKWVGGLGPFGYALKNRHTLLSKSGTM
jgi:hypothetical protein